MKEEDKESMSERKEGGRNTWSDVQFCRAQAGIVRMQAAVKPEKAAGVMARITAAEENPLHASEGSCLFWS